MDIGAYAQIDDLAPIMEKNGIEIPRLRGLRLMKNETAISKEKIEKEIKTQWLWACESACRSDFIHDADSSEYSDRTDALVKKYIIFDAEGQPIGIKWNVLHGKKRKLFKYELKVTRRSMEKQYDTFNKYCGHDGVLYIHARLGGLNWIDHKCKELEKQPWFIEKVDDSYDGTYCDIYARIKKEGE